MSRSRQLAAVAAALVLLVVVAAYPLVGPSAHIAVPPAGAPPEQVAQAWIDANNARDLGTLRAIAADDARGERQLPSRLEVVTSRNLQVTDVDLGEVRDYERVTSGLTHWREAKYVPVTFQVVRSDGSMARDGRTVWGYVLVRNSVDERWQLVDQGV